MNIKWFIKKAFFRQKSMRQKCTEYLDDLRRKGVIIGDNCIVGIGSVVTKSIPSNSVAVGVPAKVVCTYQDYMKKRSNLYVEEAIEYANAIYDSGREPIAEDFYDDYPCFVDGSNYNQYNYPYNRIFTPPSLKVG